jgi:glycerophosphoryl diester phosphodiesterase
VIVLGHRGGRGDGWPVENTLEAFQRALDEGADGVELDVRLCASGEPVLVHDSTLAHVTDGADRRRVDLVRHADLPRLRGGARIAALAEALDLGHGRVVNVEVKADVMNRVALVRSVARVVARARDVDVVISSFDPAVVLAFVVALPRTARAILVGPRTMRLGTALPLAMRWAIGAAHLGDALVTAGRVQRLRGAGLRVAAWTVNDGARSVELASFGVGCVITDRPESIVSALRAIRAA